jgi:hypothetical protein
MAQNRTCNLSVTGRPSSPLRHVFKVPPDNMHDELPPTPRRELWSAQRYAATFGLAPPPAAAAAPAGSSSSAAAARAEEQARRQQRVEQQVNAMFAQMSFVQQMLREPVQLTKGQKKNANKKQKKAAARAAAAAGPRAQLRRYQIVLMMRQHEISDSHAAAKTAVWLPMQLLLCQYGAPGNCKAQPQWRT